MLPFERLPYSPITQRPRLALPGARLAIWIIINVEEWNPREPLPRTVLTPPAGGSPIPDIPNWAWHEYGNRVGFWRMLEVIDRFKLPVALAINGSAIQTYEPIARAALDRGWEFIGHGFSQKNMQKVADERAEIAKTTEIIRGFTGRAPRGWLGPGLTETWETPDILAEEGYQDVCDWVLDDQPVMLNTRTRPLVGVPVLAGVQRRRDDAHSASHRGRISGPRDQSIRAAVRRCARVGPHHGACRPPLHHGSAASAAVFQRGAGAPTVTR